MDSSEMARRRWANKTPEERSAAASKAARARMAKLTPEQRQELGRKGGIAKGKNRKRRPKTDAARMRAIDAAATELLREVDALLLISDRVRAKVDALKRLHEVQPT